MVIREQITIQAFIYHNMLRLLFYNTALLCYLDNIAIFYDDTQSLCILNVASGTSTDRFYLLDETL
ncbi:hypothetical protein JR92_003978 [Salmonella enterica subsp. enterica serovar Soerenga]|nr:hypothetical protein [Salmonella enterica subsp. enterica serovar Liverpool]EBZ3626802.1 hypothetical protein [Salmonella enterica subsp. enterica serovar Mbandaka]ECC9905336.1 hypothetical protein [Salmonella enterica subsp. enterica]EDW1832328.1 hypothetical protein [Salmonella enterica subsp. enterica serovar Soerenga]EED9260958.1 hypothetical protein [Salmonella enterica subsp. enterica serovar Goldcoast]PYZ20712.1 hypothetical protein DNK77_26525 [Enterobacter cloacae complex sp.]HBX7